jgi:hypothetical protein
MTPHDCPRCASREEQLRRMAALVSRLQEALTAYVRVDERQTKGTSGPVLTAMRRRARALALKAWM